MKYIASCSFGKDSLATILLALLHKEPLNKVVYCEVMFDIKNNMQACEKIKETYPKEHKKLQRMYKSKLIRFHKFLPIKNNINLYRYGFPKLTKLYKKVVHMKELVNFGK